MDRPTDEERLVRQLDWKGVEATIVDNSRLHIVWRRSATASLDSSSRIADMMSFTSLM